MEQQATSGARFKVLIAVDASESSDQAVEYYLDNLHKKENEVVILHVVELPETANEARQQMLSAHAISEMWSQSQKDAKKLETRFAEKIQQRGAAHIIVKTEGSMKPGHTICKVAESEKINMIVMGTRGLGTIRRTVLGSVSDHVIHHAHCPVIVYRK